MTKKKFNWDIWSRKVLFSVLSVLLAGGVSVWAENPTWLAIVPALYALQNFLKHKGWDSF